MFTLSDYLLMLPPDAIDRAARDARHLARDLEIAAKRKRRHHRIRSNVRLFRKRWKDITEVLASYIAAGQAEYQAVRIVALQFCKEDEQIEELLPKARRLVAEGHLRRRNRRIVRLARQGYSDKQIAAMTADPASGKQLHPKSVNRIIRRDWRAA